MEAFLTTLPPYVHEFLNRYPPTDVFNLLRELICFAVLYTEDREKLNQSTADFLKKKRENKDEEEKPTVEEDAVVPEEKSIEPIAEETENELESLKTKPVYNVRTGEIIHAGKSNMPNTFPEWWGHRESEPQKAERKETVENEKKEDSKSLPQSFGSSWVSWENEQPNSTTSSVNRRMERARSQIIPDLRSYLVEDSKPTTSRTAPSSNSSSSAASIKKRYSLNTNTTPNATKITTKPQRRISSPSICESPVSTVTAQSKFIQTAAKQQQSRQNKNTPPSSSGTSTPTQSASVILKQPRQNAAMRARAEHARMQQEELEKRKNAPAIGSSTSLRMKQRVNSGIDWNTIKRDRRKTVAEAPATVPKKD
ncbi:hypothetical protein [Parasitella parasitica]|uniref:Uncharacterized protein n=1 Tax=Parasitella parasitica TaxID=35722 RepID=A0A0B7NEK7_9FUNG|nr:hypothetical protein [Parasitella parasitica]